MRYAAVVHHVREVTLQASTDPARWEPVLEKIGLYPYLCNGRAIMLISGVIARWRGKRFRESVVAVHVSRTKAGDRLDGVYLVCAFHSSPLFAWIERTFFKTPHRPAAIDINDDLPVSHMTRDGLTPFLEASMGRSREPAREEDLDWLVPIYLPNRRDGVATERNVFHARIAGSTRIYPFDPERDCLTFNHKSDLPAVRFLAESDIVGQEWHIRSDSIHARTKTTTEHIAQIALS